MSEPTEHFPGPATGCPQCGGGPVLWKRYCGARVCQTCGSHIGLVRCYCGWAENGGDGRQQLIDCGETIGDENE